MAVLLKSLGLLLGWVAVTTFWGLNGMARSGDLERLRAGGAFGVLTLGFGGLVVVLGGFAAVQLIRLRPSGRRAAQLLFGAIALYYPLGAALGGGFGAPVALATLLAGLALAFVSSAPAARAVGACHDGDPDETSQ